MMTTVPNRHWYQFGVASLFWLMLVVALIVTGISERAKRVSLEADVVELTARVKKLEARPPNTAPATTIVTRQMQTSGETRP